MTLALSIYLRTNVSNNVLACFTGTGQVVTIILYSKKVGYRPYYVQFLQYIMRTNPEKGTELATSLVNDPEGPLREGRPTLAGKYVYVSHFYMRKNE